MKTHLSYISKWPLIMCCLVLTLTTHAQNIKTDKIQWNASGFTDLIHKAEASGAACQFITTGSKIDWIQDHGNYIQSFTVVNTTGNWDDINKSGSIVFAVKSDELAGEISFQRGTKGLDLQIVLSGSTSPIEILYQISSIEKP
jgi:hypothetical protein